MNEHHPVKKMTHKNVLRFFVCLLIAFLLWFYVMYTESPEYDQEYTNIRVELRGYTPSYEFDIEYPETIDVTFRGTNVDLAQCDSDDIVAVIRFPSELTSSGERSVTVAFEFLNGVSLEPLKEVRTTLSLVDADIKEQVFENVRVEIGGQKIENYEILTTAIPQLTVRGRAEDLLLLQNQGITATASLTHDHINTIRDKVQDDEPYEMTMKVDISLPEGMSCWTSSDSDEVITTVLVRKLQGDDTNEIPDGFESESQDGDGQARESERKS